MDKPLVSIITINYNNAEGLRKTLESVRSQTASDYEHIIIDGGSTDGSAEVIESFLKDENYKTHVIFWCSEKDKGIYNAMNKGISHANGKYCLVLNSADTLFDKNVIETVIPLLDDTDIISGILEGDNFKKIPDENFSLFSYKDSYVPHGATFVKTDICKQHPFNEQYRIIADYVFFYEILNLENITYKTIPNTIEYFDLSGVSTGHNSLHEQELNQFYNTIMPKLLWKDYELYCHFDFFEKAIQRSKFWKFVYKVCRKLIHVFMKIG